MLLKGPSGKLQKNGIGILISVFANTWVLAIATDLKKLVHIKPHIGIKSKDKVGPIYLNDRLNLFKNNALS